MLTINRICVYCGSRVGTGAIYKDAAIALGKTMAAHGIGLVYGGGNVGLMGVIANTILDNGGEVIGIIPKGLSNREGLNHESSQLFVVDTMHDRKAMMAEYADAFIAMPGGYGTFEELFEAITWLQLGIHRKPIGVYNIAGFYDMLLNMIDHAISKEFIVKANRQLIQVSDDPTTLIKQLRSFDRSQFPVKWEGLEP